MKTSWEKTRSGRTHYCNVCPREVEVGDHHGSGHSDNAGRCTHQEFLEGRFHSAIRSAFGGRVLTNVIAAVEWITQQPDVVAQLRLEEEQLDSWEKIPVVEELARLARDADEDGYRDNYGRARNRSTVVHLTNTVKLVARRSGRSYLFHPDGSRVAFPHGSMSMIGHGGFVYCAAIHLSVYDVNAACVFDSESMARSHGIGVRYAIRNVLRKGDVVMCSYENLHGSEFPRSAEVLGRGGLLWFELDRGFVGRLVVDLGALG